jgi:hypothetical protein
MYGARAPLVAVGWTEQVPDAVTANSLPGQLHGLWATAGELTARKASRSYLLRWASGPARQVAEVLPFQNAFFFYNFSAVDPGACSPTLLSSLAGRRVALDPVVGSLLETMPARHSITLFARSVASWWRVNEESRNGITDRYPAEAVAAALHRATCFWSYADCSYADGAKFYGTDEGLIRKVTSTLQRHLGLCRLQPW